MREGRLLKSSSVVQERSAAIKRIREMLARCGFFVSNDYMLRGVSFDVICRRDNLLLVIKVLVNIDSFSPSNASELKTLARALKAAPVIIGDRCGSGRLSDGIIYIRHGVPIMSFSTMREYFEEGVPPFIFAAPGGLFARIDPEIIKKVRREKGLSLGALAEAAGVSKKAVQMYELGAMSATLPVVGRLEKFLGEPIVIPLNPFPGSDKPDQTAPPSEAEGENHFKTGVFKKLIGLGYNVIQTRRCPFDAISESQLRATVLVTGVGQANGECLFKAQVISNVSSITEKNGVLFLDRRISRENISGTPVICRDELSRIHDEEKILRLIQERRK
ncbi:MAG: transcriptional regulator [Thermoplasmatota archaeon]